MFKKIFRGVRNVLKSPAGMLGLGALALGPMGGFGALKGLLGSGALGGLKGGILPGILGLLTARALQGEGKEEAVSFDDFESQTSKKYGSKFGGSPFLADNFRDLKFNPADNAFYDYVNNQGIFSNYTTDKDGKIIEEGNQNNKIGPIDDEPTIMPLGKQSGGIAQLNMGGNPFMARQKMMIGGPLRASKGSEVSIESVMNQKNPTPEGIAQYFPPKMGMIFGPGGPKDDKIPAMLSNGEFVFTAKAVDNAGGPKAMYNLMNKLDPESSKGRGIIS
jgi:hypothetical protein